MDDYEGQLTRNGVTNFHGMIKFEIARVYTLDTNEPTTGWDEIHPLAETYSFRDKLADGNNIKKHILHLIIYFCAKQRSNYIMRLSLKKKHTFYLKGKRHDIILFRCNAYFGKFSREI